MTLTRTIPIAAVAAIFSANSAHPQATTGSVYSAPMPYIEASGTGQVQLAPDRATVTVGVETRAVTAAAAGAENARIQHAVADTLRKMGFSGSAVTTTRMGIAPEMDYAEGHVRQTGYVARYSMKVELSALDRIGDVVDAALARGANVAGNVVYSSSSADSAQQAAIAIAAAKARRQAATLAASLGGSLGSLIQATTSGGDGGRVVLGYGGGSQTELRAGTTVTPTQVTVVAAVSARWHFLGR
jgi:uncharacterized protein YggE